MLEVWARQCNRHREVGSECVCVCGGGGVRGVCVKQETGLQPRIPWLWHSEAEGESEQCLQNESRNQHLWNT